jgi:hypothetical protein
MNRFLTRVVAVLLVACLAGEPVAYGSPGPVCLAPAPPRSSLSVTFSSQALAAQPIGWVRIGRIKNTVAVLTRRLANTFIETDRLSQLFSLYGTFPDPLVWGAQMRTYKIKDKVEHARHRSGFLEFALHYPRFAESLGIRVRRYRVFFFFTITFLEYPDVRGLNARLDRLEDTDIAVATRFFASPGYVEPEEFDAHWGDGEAVISDPRNEEFHWHDLNLQFAGYLLMPARVVRLAKSQMRFLRTLTADPELRTHLDLMALIYKKINDAEGIEILSQMMTNKALWSDDGSVPIKGLGDAMWRLCLKGQSIKSLAESLISSEGTGLDPFLIRKYIPKEGTGDHLTREEAGRLEEELPGQLNKWRRGPLPADPAETLGRANIENLPALEKMLDLQELSNQDRLTIARDFDAFMHGHFPELTFLLDEPTQILTVRALVRDFLLSSGSIYEDQAQIYAAQAIIFEKLGMNLDQLRLRLRQLAGVRYEDYNILLSTLLIQTIPDDVPVYRRTSHLGIANKEGSSFWHAGTSGWAQTRFPKSTSIHKRSIIKSSIGDLRKAGLLLHDGVAVAGNSFVLVHIDETKVAYEVVDPAPADPANSGTYLRSSRIAGISLFLILLGIGSHIPLLATAGLIAWWLFGKSFLNYLYLKKNYGYRSWIERWMIHRWIQWTHLRDVEPILGGFSYIPTPKQTDLLLAVAILNHGGPLSIIDPLGNMDSKWQAIRKELASRLATNDGIIRKTVHMEKRLRNPAHVYFEYLIRMAQNYDRRYRLHPKNKWLIELPLVRYLKWLAGLRSVTLEVAKFLESLDLVSESAQTARDFIFAYAHRHHFNAQALQAFLSDEMLMDLQPLDLNRWLYNNRDWQSKGKNFDIEPPVIRPGTPRVLANPFILHLAMERAISNGFHAIARQGWWIREDSIRIVAQPSKDPHEVDIIIASPGWIDSTPEEILYRQYTFKGPGSPFSHGIGMPFSRSAVEKMGGRVTIENKVLHRWPRIQLLVSAMIRLVAAMPFIGLLTHWILSALRVREEVWVTLTLPAAANQDSQPPTPHYAPRHNRELVWAG